MNTQQIHNVGEAYGDAWYSYVRCILDPYLLPRIEWTSETTSFIT